MTDDKAPKNQNEKPLNPDFSYADLNYAKAEYESFKQAAREDKLKQYAKTHVQVEEEFLKPDNYRFARYDCKRSSQEEKNKDKRFQELRNKQNQAIDQAHFGPAGEAGYLKIQSIREKMKAFAERGMQNREQGKTGKSSWAKHSMSTSFHFNQ